MEIGEIFNNKYKIISLIGKGGMCCVYLAIDISTHMIWAIKEFKKTKSAKDIFISSYLKEAKVLSKLCHPGIPRIEKVIEMENTLIIIMDYIEGIVMNRFVQEHKSISEELTINFAKQLTDILGFIHSKNIIYGDLKPSNIMVQSNGSLILIDFGAVIDISVKKNDVFCIGTRGYAAPEQYAGQCDFRTDIYSFGMTLFYMLTGISPNYNNNFSIREINPNFSVSLEYIILKCIQADPNDRYQNFYELDYDINNMNILEKKLKLKYFFKFKSKNVFKRRKAVEGKRNIPLSSIIPPFPISNETTVLSDDNIMYPIPPSVIDNEKKYIFLSYCHHDRDLADIICNQFVEFKFINISRYTTGVPYKSSFKEFMNTLGTHDKVIMIISDQYLKSTACMYEVGQLINSPNFQSKILFIICSDNDKKYYKIQTNESIEAKIYDPHERNKYVIFWENKCEVLENDLKTIKNDCAKIETLEIIRDIKKIINHDIGSFMKYLADVNGISFDVLYQHNFKEFFKELGIN